MSTQAMQQLIADYFKTQPVFEGMAFRLFRPRRGDAEE